MNRKAKVRQRNAVVCVLCMRLECCECGEINVNVVTVEFVDFKFACQSVAVERRIVTSFCDKLECVDLCCIQEIL